MFPAGAGVILDDVVLVVNHEGVSRRRGGDPDTGPIEVHIPRCFPQARG